MEKKKPLYKKVFRSVRDIVFIIILKPIWKRIITKVKAHKFCKRLAEASERSGHPVVIYVSYFNYYYPLIQRPNHIFNILSSKGYPCVVCGNRKKLTIPKDNLFIIPTRWLKHILKGKFPKVFDVSLGFPYNKIKDINKYLTDEMLVLYELIDDFDLLREDRIITKAKQMFVKLAERDNTFILTTAEHLKNTAIQMGVAENKIINNKNAVIVQDFEPKVESAEIMRRLKEKHKPIIGYYGALTATWFDFDMVLELVKKHSEYEFVLIGLLYPDKNLQKTNQYLDELNKFDNFTYIPPIHYTEIPSYAKCWDVATIPFQINEITKSTSPVKLFEYMAMGLPIVTTPMVECKLYKSVFIADGADDFAEKIKIALSHKDDKQYQETLHREACENTWEKRVDDIIEIIEKHYKKHILIVSNIFTGGGLEKRLNNIVNQFHDKYDFSLITKTRLSDMKIKPSSYFKKIYNWDDHEFAIKNTDIIDVHPFFAGDILTKWKVPSKIKKIYTLHGKDSLNENLNFLNDYDRVYIVSELLRDSLCKKYPFTKDKIFLSKNREVIQNYKNNTKISKNILFSITNTRDKDFTQSIIDVIPSEYTIHIIGLFQKDSFSRTDGQIIYHGFVNIDDFFTDNNFDIVFVRGGYAAMNAIARNIACLCAHSNEDGAYFEAVTRDNFEQMSNFNFVARKDFGLKKIIKEIKHIEKSPENYRCSDLLQAYNDIKTMPDLYKDL